MTLYDSKATSEAFARARRWMPTNSDTVTMYIAFSIHGTHAFITATRDVARSKLADTLAEMYQKGITVSVASRRPSFDSSKEIKLRWTGLQTKTGTPLKSPPLVVQRFKQLEAEGWTVRRDTFVSRHWRTKKNDSVGSVSR